MGFYKEGYTIRYSNLNVPTLSNYDKKKNLLENEIDKKKKEIEFQQNRHKEFLEQNNLDYITIDANNIDWNLIETFSGVKIIDKSSDFIPLKD